jgi:hypothetical protein
MAESSEQQQQSLVSRVLSPIHSMIMGTSADAGGDTKAAAESELSPLVAGRAPRPLPPLRAQPTSLPLNTLSPQSNQSDGDGEDDTSLVSILAAGKPAERNVLASTLFKQSREKAREEAKAWDVYVQRIQDYIDAVTPAIGSRGRVSMPLAQNGFTQNDRIALFDARVRGYVQCRMAQRGYVCSGDGDGENVGIGRRKKFACPLLWIEWDEEFATASKSTPPDSDLWQSYWDSVLGIAPSENDSSSGGGAEDHKVSDGEQKWQTLMKMVAEEQKQPTWDTESITEKRARLGRLLVDCMYTTKTPIPPPAASAASFPAPVPAATVAIGPAAPAPANRAVYPPLPVPFPRLIGPGDPAPKPGESFKVRL